MHDDQLHCSGNQTEVASPCTRVCILDDARTCIGCRRTLNEIARWPYMTNEEKRAVVDALPERKG
jgi:predicted Fe-S protein YdhL (DUF1289 family)